MLPQILRGFSPSPYHHQTCGFPKQKYDNKNLCKLLLRYKVYRQPHAGTKILIKLALSLCQAYLQAAFISLTDYRPASKKKKFSTSLKRDNRHFGKLTGKKRQTRSISVRRRNANRELIAKVFYDFFLEHSPVTEFRDFTICVKIIIFTIFLRD